MKRIAKFLILCMAVLCLGGCGKSKYDAEKITMIGQQDLTAPVEITKHTLTTMVENKENFVLYIYQDGCSHCQTFSPVLEEFVAKYNAVVYKISGVEIGGGKNEIVTYEGTPTIAVFRGGIAYNKFIPKASLTKFEEQLGEFAYFPRMLKINRNQLDYMLERDIKFIVYFGWKACGDCKSFERDVLNEYLALEMKDQVIYYFDVDQYRYLGADNDAWINFAKHYNLFSYRGGKVPTLQYYDDGELKDMIVYVNDRIVCDDSDKNCEIKESFQEILVNGKVYDSKDLAVEAAKKVHKKEFVKFMQENLKLVDSK